MPYKTYSFGSIVFLILIVFAAFIFVGASVVGAFDPLRGSQARALDEQTRHEAEMNRIEEAQEPARAQAAIQRQNAVTYTLLAAGLMLFAAILVVALVIAFQIARLRLAAQPGWIDARARAPALPTAAQPALPHRSRRDMYVEISRAHQKQQSLSDTQPNPIPLDPSQFSWVADPRDSRK